MISTMFLSFAYGHYLGASKFGELYFAIAFVTLIGTFTDGFGNQIIRDVAQKPENASRYCSNVLLIKLVSWLILYTLIMLASWLLGYSVEVRILIVICGFDLLCNVVVNTFVSIQYALESTTSPVIGGLFEKGLVALLGFLLLRAGAGVWVMSLILVTGSLVNVIWQAIWYLRRVGTSFTIDSKLVRKLVRTDLPFLFSSIMLTGYNSIDTVLISLMKNSAAVGFYGAAARITDNMNFLPSIVMMVVMYPVIAKLATTSDAKMKVALEKSMNFLLYCVVPISTIFVVAAPNIIGFLYGGGFTQSVPALQALAPCLIFVSINCVLVTVILSKRQDKFIPISNGVALAFNIGLNLILIPHFLQVGSAIVATLTEFLLICINVFIIPRSLLPLGSLGVAFKALIASLLMAIAIYPLHTLHIFVLLPIAMLIYLGSAFVLGVLPREDYIAVYHAILGKRRQNTSHDTEEKWDISALAYDLPTIPLPAFFGDIALEGTKGTLLDIQMAITGQLPIIRLPQAPQGAGLLTKNPAGSMYDSLPETPFPSYSLQFKSGRSYYNEPLDVALPGTTPLPTIRPHSEQRSLKAIQLQPIQRHSSAKQERLCSSLQGFGDIVR